MDFLKSIFTRKKPLSSNVRQNNTVRGNYEYNQFEAVENANFSNVNPALRNLKIKRGVNAYERAKNQGYLEKLIKAHNTALANPGSLAKTNKNTYINSRNSTLKTLKTLQKLGKNYPANIALLETLNFESIPVKNNMPPPPLYIPPPPPLQNATGLATNNAMSVATNDPRKLSGASNISGGRRPKSSRKTRRVRKNSRRNRRRN